MRRRTNGEIPVFLVLGLVLALNAPGSMARAQDAENWGAVAVGPWGAYGWAVDAASEAEAEAGALSGCDGQCTQKFSFHDTCGAIAIGGERAFWGTGAEQSAAEQAALEACRAQIEGSCEAIVGACAD